MYVCMYIFFSKKYKIYRERDSNFSAPLKVGLTVQTALLSGPSSSRGSETWLYSLFQGALQSDCGDGKERSCYPILLLNSSLSGN